MVDYCPKCDSILYPKKKEDGAKVLFCKTCGYEMVPGASSTTMFKDSKELDHTYDKTLVKDEAYFKSIYGEKPSERECPRCKGKMIMLVRQTRKADEGPTIFYTCVVCNKQIRIGS
ncbi:MAG: RPA12/RPB9/RPC11 RNA polymerase family protein [Candidatus Lokiarchaeota archaeon]|nr:RPA12/RPB9/RPC11 RNA polymerase family protein [Candidatus Lokiarchaeota archaeon]